MQLPPAATELTKKLNEATLEDVVDNKPEEQKTGRSDSPPEAQGEPSAVTSVRSPASKQPEVVKEEGPQDLRVFELNSDSGKSTPSNNGKKGTTPCYCLPGTENLIVLEASHCWAFVLQAPAQT